MNIANKRLLTYALSHFTVDFACFFYLFNTINKTQSLVDIAFYFFLYNIIAFGIQCFIGLLLDKYHNLPLGLIGCTLVLTGISINLGILVSLVLICLGNACFHVAGGRDSLVSANNHCDRSGFFVSWGSLGVMSGTLLGTGSTLPFLPYVLLMICMVLCYLVEVRESNFIKETNFDKATSMKPLNIVLLVLGCIVIRSLLGPLLNRPINTISENALIYIAFFAFVGKLFGGYLADYFGCKKVGIISLALACIFFFIGLYTNLIFLLLSITFFNILMAISVCTLASVLKKQPAFAFGLTTLALLVGTIPFAFISINPPYDYITIVIGIILAIVAVSFTSNNKIED